MRLKFYSVNKQAWIISIPAYLFIAYLTFLLHSCAAFLWLMLIFQAPSAMAADRVGDEFLTGYITSILERDLHWKRDSYILKIVNGVATITLFKDDPVRREAAEKQLHTIDGLHKVVIVVKPADTYKPEAVSRFLGITGEGEAFPTGNLFRPLLADPKQTQFFVSINRFKSSGLRYTMASVGFGETFGLYRVFGSRKGDGLQLSVEGAIFAQFNMDATSYDLINADYIIGIPATYRHGDNSLRFRIYHQSSHLGDEFLQSVNPPERVNLSYEAIELIYSREWRGWRVYGGGEYMIHKEPADLKPMSAHWGIEYLGSKPLVWKGRLVGGVDMKSFEEHNWAIDTSVKAGLEFGHPNPGQRRLRLMAEWYKGFDPRGQFYNNKVDYYGLGVSLGF
ncbi:MAG: DUF1207 domain-containing protein [Nitrospiraceae bacterium]|nr:MAG: DUF1207 domain-containing protein [Nitrospiraceae bacterium]